MRRNKQLLQLGLITLSMNGLVSQLHADAAIGLYNPFNHGLLTFTEIDPINELREDRVDVVHRLFAPSTSSFQGGFSPFYTFPSDDVFTNSTWGLAGC